MEGQYDFGMIGLGVMGSNLLLNLADHGYASIGFDLKPERAKALEDAAKEGTVVKGVGKLEEMVRALKKPRKIMMLVPAGKPVDDVIANLLPLVEEGDIVIDGGNSFYRDTLQRIGYLQEKGIHFFGMGVSGGEMGARVGPSMMPGGDKEAYKYLQPLLEAIAAHAKDGEPCVAYMGNGAAGHYVKMVHNGIEYAIMQMISEVYDLLKRGGGLSNGELHAVFNEWNEGPLKSFLIKITAEIFNTGDSETPGTDDFLLDQILDQAGSKGTGKWTSQEAMNLPVPVPTIDAAVAARTLSVFKKQRVIAAKLYQPEVAKLTLPKDEVVNYAERALEFCYIIAYAQGLQQLSTASEALGMNIPVANVIKVWRQGCIIRSAMLENFYLAYQKNSGLENLLLDEDIAELIVATHDDMKEFAILAIKAGVAIPGMMSALAYFEGFCSERMPTNLIQAQRDYFGAHTYQRTDKEGVFHTEWNESE
ncbi:MAG TPA: NADP-dependent phosphogluconate dehydrogenase [Flavisolibacter sp.]|jgi:6-phosphogluconate dehydrogenase|nr:NADP-dependent phosphogluconate dehydrogenase [Flavisolibacter sp.]